MKKFSFSLGTVLDYKNQVLDTLMNEHGSIIVRINAQEKRIADMEQEYTEHNQAYIVRKTRGMAVVEAQSYEGYFRVMEVRIKREKEVLLCLQAEEEAKRKEVVEAKKETSSIEKLKEKKLVVYEKAVQKSEELFVEEFVSYKRLVNSQS